MTFTILASDPTKGLLAAATASRSLAVGAGVPAVRVGIGAAASQAYTNRSLRSRLLDALAAGDSPSSAVARIPEWDAGAVWRQAAVVAADGAAAAHTGEACTAWAGSESGAGFVVLGNLLPGPEVVEAMCVAFERYPEGTNASALDVSEGDRALANFSRRVLAALAAGDAAGGDLRGRQSAAILVGVSPVPSGATPTGQSSPGRTATWNAVEVDDEPLAIDLRADDHERPIDELARLLELALAERRAAGR